MLNKKVPLNFQNDWNLSFAGQFVNASLLYFELRRWQ